MKIQYQVLMKLLSNESLNVWKQRKSLSTIHLAKLNLNQQVVNLDATNDHPIKKMNFSSPVHNKVYK